HNIPLSPEREKETEQTLSMMFGVGYIQPEEVPGIPRLAKTPAAIVYAPLAETPVAPHAVMFACKPSSAMLLNEAPTRARIGGAGTPHMHGASRVARLQLFANEPRLHRQSRLHRPR